MKMKVLWMCAIGAMIASSAMGQVITSVVRTGGTTDNRTPIGAYTGTTAPLPTQAGGLKDGNYVFSDREFQWANVPATGAIGPLNKPLLGSEYVRTFNSDKSSSTFNIAVTISQLATLWITIDDRFTDQQGYANTATAKFAAAGTFKDTGLNVSTSNGDTNTLSIWAADFGPGTYNFSFASSSNNNYVIGAVEGDPKFNPAPAVNAGLDQAFAKPTFPLVVTMNATVTDQDPVDPTEPRGTLSYAWSFVSGPETPAISNAVIEDPTVTIASKPGEYVMKLTASDGSKSSEDTMTIYVNDVSKNMLMAHWNFESLTTTNKSVVDVAKSNNGVWTAAEPNQVPTIVPGWITGSAQAVDFRTPAANPPIVKTPGPGWVNVDIADTEPNLANGPRYAITLSTWIKVSAFNKEYSAIISKGDDTWRLARLGTTNTLAMHFNTGPNYGPSGSIAVNDNFWHHVCGTYDGEKIRLYIDGVLDVEGAFTGLINTNTLPVRISENSGATGRQWDGILDDVRIYNYALSETELRALTAQGKTIPFVDAGTLPSPLTYKTGEQIPLNGKVLDYGTPGTINAMWTTVSGPDGAEATFANPSSPTTTVLFPKFGQYTLRLSAVDTDIDPQNPVTVIDEITVDVIRPTCADVKAAGMLLVGDIDENCRVNLADFALMASEWLRCNDPANYPACFWPFPQ